MHTKLKFLIALSSVLLTMCTFYDPQGAVIAPNGVSCQSHTSVASVEGQGDNNHFYMYRQAAECSYQCPDGKFKEFELSEKFSTSSPIYSASKQELDSQYCGTSAQASVTPTQPPAAVSPLPTEFPTASPVPVVSPTEQVSSSPTAEATAAVQASPLLRGDVTMCDVAANLINFRMVEPVPDISGKALEVQIADQQSLCAINPVNTSLLTCTIPASVTFPVRVVVRLDGVVVNDFTYSGLGCAKISTPFPTTTP
jgi:hypothetical protein